MVPVRRGVAAGVVMVLSWPVPGYGAGTHRAVRQHAGAVRSGGYELRLVEEHVAQHARCRQTILNGIADDGEIIGTAYCGHRDEAFLQSPTGEQVRYRLPRRVARDTLGSNIAADGTFVVIGIKRRGGPETSYVVSADRRHRQALRDPKAHGHGTVVNGINKRGTAVGVYCPTARCHETKPFVYRRGQFGSFSIHEGTVFFVTPTQINDSGEISGFDFDESGRSGGFVKDPQSHVAYPVVAAHSGSKPGTGDHVSSVSSNDFVVGSALDDNNRRRAFVTYYDHYVTSFISRTPDRPKSFTELISVNSSRVVVGFWYDARHHRDRGLIGTPVQ